MPFFNTNEARTKSRGHTKLAALAAVAEQGRTQKRNDMKKVLPFVLLSLAVFAVEARADSIIRLKLKQAYEGRDGSGNQVTIPKGAFGTQDGIWVTFQNEAWIATPSGSTQPLGSTFVNIAYLGTYIEKACDVLAFRTSTDIVLIQDFLDSDLAGHFQSYARGAPGTIRMAMMDRTGNDGEVGPTFFLVDMASPAALIRLAKEQFKVVGSCAGSGPISPPTSDLVGLNVTKSGTGGGTVVSSAGISCGASCSANFAKGTRLTLSAIPDSGSLFQGWSGGGCFGVGDCTVDLQTATTVSATFSSRSGPCPQCSPWGYRDRGNGEHLVAFRAPVPGIAAVDKLRESTGRRRSETASVALFRSRREIRGSDVIA